MLRIPPVMERELIGMLRTPRAFWLHGLFVAALGTVIVASWEGTGEFLLVTADRARAMYSSIAAAEILLLCLLAPALSAPSLASERERRSLELLLTTPMSLGSILLGKLLSSVCFLLILAISSVPVFALCVLMGGVSPQTVLGTALIAGVLAVLGGTMGLYFSAVMGRTHSALAATYAVALPVMGGIVALCPLASDRSLPAAVFVAVMGGAATVWIFLAAVARFRESVEALPLPPDEEDREYQAGLTIDRRRFPDSLIAPRHAGRPMDETANRIAAKELRFELLGRGTGLLRLVLTAGILGALVALVVSLAQATALPYGSFILLYLMLVVPSFTANAYTQERERGTFDLLRATPISGAEIRVGKLWMALRTALVMGGLLGSGLPLVWVTLASAKDVSDTMAVSGANAVIGTLACLAGCALLTAVLGLFFSYFSRSTARAVVLTYVVAGALYFLPVAAHQLAHRALPAGDVAAWDGLTLTSPFFALAGVEETRDDRGIVHMVHAGLGIRPAHRVRWVGFLAVSCALCAAMLVSMRRAWERDASPGGA